MAQTRFLDKTLLAVVRTAEQALFSEAYARQRGLLQSIDIRVKIFTFLSLIVAVSMARTLPVLWLFYGFGLACAALSRVPLGFFIKRVWFFAPLMSAVIVLPAILNVVTPGDPVWTLLRFDRPHAWGPYVVPQEIAVTHQGLLGAAVFVSRVAASVSFAVLLTLTSRWSEIFSGLRSLFVPRIFVMTLGMTERYLFVFLRMIQDMHRARKSRTIRRLSASEERSWIASRIGMTFIRSVELSRDIYKAMLSRGYYGEVIAPDPRRLAAKDYIWLVLIVSLGGIMLALERGLLS